MTLIQLGLMMFASASIALADTPKQQHRPVPITPTDAELIAAKSLSIESDILPLLRTFCFECHRESESNGDLNLESLVQLRPLVAGRRQWINIKEQLRVGSMPPSDAEQPPVSARRKLIAWLTVAIDHFDYETVRQVGYEPARRLSHDEYNHTIRDLIGIDLRPADLFPTDMTATSGFDNSANSLFFQPVNLERFVSAADRVVELAYPDQPIDAATKRSRARLLGNTTASIDARSARSAMFRFAFRAFRRPLEPEHRQSLGQHFDRALTSGMSPYDALRDTLRIILVTPSFLIRSEQAGPADGGAYPISDWELASRLSYFLWASMPDDELLQLAKANQLHRSDVLTAQVDRMLKDARAKTLGTIFAGQWLGFAHLKRMQPDQIDNPWADDALMAAMQAESAALFNSIIADDEPLDRLLDADYTYLNQQLAKHYRIDGVRGSQIRRVSLAENPRRGILGHGSILAITSFQHRVSPVVRGNWILSELLGTPPPPPPPNVSDFDEAVEEADLSPRGKLEKHRDNPNCYACHSQIDPLGFALEHYDWFGRYRRLRSRGPTVAVGKLPDGTTFKGIKGLSAALIKGRMDDLCKQIARKMLAYALGRQLEYYDEATVNDLVQRLESNERRMQSLIHGIVHSDTFQKREAEIGKE